MSFPNSGALSGCSDRQRPCKRTGATCRRGIRSQRHAVSTMRAASASILVAGLRRLGPRPAAKRSSELVGRSVWGRCHHPDSQVQHARLLLLEVCWLCSEPVDISVQVGGAVAQLRAFHPAPVQAGSGLQWRRFLRGSDRLAPANGGSSRALCRFASRNDGAWRSHPLRGGCVGALR